MTRTQENPVVNALGEQFAPDDILIARVDTEPYMHDAAPLSEAGAPLAVVFPRDTRQVQHALRTAARFGVPIVPQGARTGLAGAANAQEGCIVLSMTRMNRILEIDPANRVVRCEPGVTTRALSEAVRPHNLFYPPDPVSSNECSIGGNIATGAGGVCCVKYGVTADYVRGLSVVLADGRVTRFGHSTVKGVAGLDLTHLFIGSEGTLGIIVDATLALRPTRGDSLAVLAQFPTAAEAGRAVTTITDRGYTPSAMELMDRVATQAVTEFGHPQMLYRDAATLIVESDAPTQERDIAEIADVCTHSGAVHVATSNNPEVAVELLNARRMLTPALTAWCTSLMAETGATPTMFIEDVAVPRTQLATLMTRIAEIADQNHVLIATAGHAGDGNLHPTVIFNGDDLDARVRAQRAYDEVMAEALSLGGTITGEHGVGTLKRSWLARELDPTALELQEGIKHLFDPLNILNPGKVFIDASEHETQRA